MYFSTIGRYTLGIYVVQTFIIERLITAYIKLNEVVISPAFTDFIFIPLIGSTLCLVCYYVVRITQPIKIINIFFMGDRNRKYKFLSIEAKSYNNEWEVIDL